MSDPRQQHCTDLMSAALRHIRDAEFLHQSGEHPSLDQAEHLAGFGPECARKAMLDLQVHHQPDGLVAAFDKLLGHDFGRTADLAAGLAVALRPAFRRYPVTGWNEDRKYAALRHWTPECRYRGTGQVDLTRLGQLLEAARQITDEAALLLWLDGRLDAGGL